MNISDLEQLIPTYVGPGQAKGNIVFRNGRVVAGGVVLDGEGEDNVLQPTDWLSKVAVGSRCVVAILPGMRALVMGALGGGVAPHNKTLYSAGASGLYMQAGQSVNLSEKISEQENGIVLAWSQFENGAASNGGWNFTYIPKAHTAFNNGNGVACQLALGWKALTATKYVYVSDDAISGNAINREAPQDNFVLRYVVGV